MIHLFLCVLLQPISLVVASCIAALVYPLSFSAARKWTYCPLHRTTAQPPQPIPAPESESAIYSSNLQLATPTMWHISLICNILFTAWTSQCLVWPYGPYRLMPGSSDAAGTQGRRGNTYAGLDLNLASCHVLPSEAYCVCQVWNWDTILHVTFGE
jgi:hypothetical protein